MPREPGTQRITGLGGLETAIQQFTKMDNFGALFARLGALKTCFGTLWEAQGDPLGPCFWESVKTVQKYQMFGSPFGPLFGLVLNTIFGYNKLRSHGTLPEGLSTHFGPTWPPFWIPFW